MVAARTTIASVSGNDGERQVVMHREISTRTSQGAGVLAHHRRENVRIEQGCSNRLAHASSPKKSRRWSAICSTSVMSCGESPW